MKIVPFAEEHIEPAAALLEERHRRHREAEPLLPGEVDYRAEIQALWEKDGASGVFTEDGYLLATRPALDVAVHDGGQPRYPLLIGVE